MYCWACDELRSLADQWCPECGAPEWIDTGGSGGVYIISAPCGLWKIGLAHNSIASRVAGLERMAGERLRIEATLADADIFVEHWLHRRFADVCDRRFAEDEGLPCPTEWFWPTPALQRLASGDRLIDLDADLPQVCA